MLSLAILSRVKRCIEEWVGGLTGDVVQFILNLMLGCAFALALIFTCQL